MKWSDSTPLYDAVAAEHKAHDDAWTLARHEADLALWRYGTLREQTRTSAPGRAMDRVARALLGGAS